MKKSILANFDQILPVVYSSTEKNEISIVALSDKLLFTLMCLKKHLNYRFCLLSCISGVDFLKTKYRFGVVYDLLSLTFNSRMRVKVFVNEITAVPSSVPVYSNANWWEREVWDMFGIYFDKHPDLRRILTDYGFEGHPMRKDFPLSGYVELRYDQTKKRIVLENLELAQEFRFFNFETPW